MARLLRIAASGPIKIEPAQFPRDEQGNLKPSRKKKDPAKTAGRLLATPRK